MAKIEIIESPFESLDLAEDQRSNKIFSSILKTLLVNDNRYMTAKEIVAGIHKYEFTRLGGLTPQATVQGNISTAISMAISKKRPTPIEKRKMEPTGTGYRIARALFPQESKFLSLMDSDPPDPSPSIIKKKIRIKVNNRKKSRVHRKPKNGNIRSYDSNSDFEERISKRRGIKVSEDKVPVDNVIVDLSSESLEGNEIDEHNSSFLKANEPSDFKIDMSINPISFAIAQETGYSYPRFRSSPRRRYAKTKCEDAFCVKDLYHLDGSFLCRLFCLADGHGGSGCSAFLTTRVPDCVESMLRLYEPNQLDDYYEQEKFKQDMTDLIRGLDEEYLNAKREEYRSWQAHDVSAEPVDDGATLVINLFFGEWFININVGDSRTILASKSNDKWIVDFASEDHKPFLERLALEIFSNGGIFVDSQDKPIRFDPSPQDRPIRMNLKNARIRLQNADNDLGVPYKKNNGNNWSLNVAATCGDLLFKLNPSKPVINCVPDIYFSKLGEIPNPTDKRFILMSTDGLFDHLYLSKADMQNQVISTHVGTKLDSGEHIKNIVMHLCNREGDRSLFENTLQEYDDCTCILVSL